MRDLISLSCDTCKARNYTTTKNKKTQTDKFSIKKFCPKCRSHTIHKEGKISESVFADRQPDGCANNIDGSVAPIGRASDSKSEGSRFDPWLARQNFVAGNSLRTCVRHE